jgi:colicin import membrane protein
MALAYKEFTPPPVPGLGRAVTLAFIAHAFLVIALSLGVQWHQAALEPASFQAELWSALPVEAAPPEPALPPETEAFQPTSKKPEQVSPAPPAPEAKTNTDIVIAQQKAQRENEKKQEQARLEKERKRNEEKLKADKRKEDSAKAEKQKTDALSKAEEKKSAARLKEAKERALRLAGSTSGNGEPTATGNAAQSSGPGANYGGKIVAAIRPNITQSKEIAGNPSVEYDVYSDASGTILSVKLRKKSGDSYWDEVALNAIYKTTRLPRDDNGRVPSPITIALEPKAR